MTKTKSEIAQILLNSKAVTLNVENPYTYSSGIRSPIYCDNRLLISDIKARKHIVRAFCELAEEFKPKQIAGVATAGITWGAWMASEMELPFIYVRPKPKGHGKEKQIEGEFVREKTILIEDLLSTGQSSVQALEALNAERVPVVCLAAIFTYGFQSASELFREKQIEVRTLTDLDQLLDTGIEQKFFTQSTKIEVQRWRMDPPNWFKK